MLYRFIKKSTMKEIDRSTIEIAVKNDVKALKIIAKHLTEWVERYGVEHAQIEAKRLVIYALAGADSSELQSFEMHLMKIIEEANAKEKIER